MIYENRPALGCPVYLYEINNRNVRDKRKNGYHKVISEKALPGAPSCQFATKQTAKMVGIKTKRTSISEARKCSAPSTAL